MGEFSLHHVGSFIVVQGLSSCGTWGSVVVDCGILVPRPGIVPCIARQILKYWTTREVPSCVSYSPGKVCFSIDTQPAGTHLDPEQSLSFPLLKEPTGHISLPA